MRSQSKGKRIVVNSTVLEDRIAILENGQFTDYFFERRFERGIAGNVYKGTVQRVLPGMQAAFVEIGEERSAFLYVGDISLELDELGIDEEDEPIDFEDRRRRERGGRRKIEEMIKEKQELLVQVSKGPIGTKGARLTTHISLPGRYLVFMPTVNHIGVSRRIENPQERARLKAFVQKHAKGSGGFIVRTASQSISEKAIKNDIQYLTALWKQIQAENRHRKSPALLHAELELVPKIVRDYLDDSFDALEIDSPHEHRKLLAFIKMFDPTLKGKIRLANSDRVLFDQYGIEQEISRALGNRIWLKSGGYIIIEQTEALTAVDVNTGRYVGESNLEETILKTNLEAVREIVHQLRIRNIGGIIILDFIDMASEGNRRKLFQALNEALKADKARITVNKISSLGLVEMTRKRTRESLVGYLCESCYYCGGRGYLKSKKSICYEIYREIEREAALTRGKVIYAHVHPQIAELLCDPERQRVAELERTLRKTVVVRTNPEFHLEQFEVVAASRRPSRDGKGDAPLSAESPPPSGI